MFKVDKNMNNCVANIVDSCEQYYTNGEQCCTATAQQYCLIC